MFLRRYKTQQAVARKENYSCKTRIKYWEIPLNSSFLLSLSLTRTRSLALPESQPWTRFFFFFFFERSKPAAPLCFVLLVRTLGTHEISQIFQCFEQLSICGSNEGKKTDAIYRNYINQIERKSSIKPEGELGVFFFSGTAHNIETAVTIKLFGDWKLLMLKSDEEPHES